MELSRYEYRKLVDDVAANVVSRMATILATMKKNDSEQWMSTGMAADYLCKSKDWVRRHKAELHAVKAGDGKQDMLRFKKSELRKYIEGD